MSEEDGSNMTRSEGEYVGSYLWDKLPNDLHARVFAHLPIPSIIRSRAVCHEWNNMITSNSFKALHQQIPSQDKPWLFMCSSFNCRENCCAYNPNLDRWYVIPLMFLPPHMRSPLIAVGGLLLIRGAAKDTSVVSSANLAVCNPLTKTWHELPPMIRGRVNSLIGVFEEPRSRSFKVVVAGGTSECGGDYECTTEVYDSATDTWSVTGAVSREYTMKITDWASKPVYCMGILYCLTSARPYNIMAYNIKKGVWEEVKIPQPEGLFCSFLIKRRDQLLLVGRAGRERDGQCFHIWALESASGCDNWHSMDLSEQGRWVEIECMPAHHCRQFCEENADFDLKCVGSGDMLYFFKDSHSEMLMCDLSGDPAIWRWLPGCPLRARLLKFSVRGLFVEPSLDGIICGQA